MKAASAAVCSICGVEKPLSGFWRDVRRPGGRETTCAACRSFKQAQRLGRVAPSKNGSRLKEMLLPRLAARLRAYLHNESAPLLPAPYCDVEAVISPAAWHAVMRLVCQGMPPKVALRRVGIPRGIFDAHCQYEPRLAAWFARVKQASRRRHQPGLLAVDEVLRELIRSPGMSARTACRQHGVDYRGFIARTKTPEIEPRYLRIRALQRDRSFEGMRAELAGLGAGITRADRSDMASRAHALKRLEPRRLWTRRPLSELQQRLRDARRRARRRGER